MELKTIVCPNCGANTTNVRNCEYCNSLLVRFVDKGIDVSKTSYLAGDCIYPELPTALKQNLRLQEEHPFEPVVTTDILWVKEKLCSVSILRPGEALWLDDTPIDLGSCDEGLIVLFAFYDNHKLERDQLVKFKKLPSYPLFTSHNSLVEEVYVREYAINFGKDAKGAAMLISEILSQVYDLNPTDDYDIITNASEQTVVNARNVWLKAHNLSDYCVTPERQEIKNQILLYIAGGIMFVLYLILTSL